MAEITVYGSSDDLIEIEGDIEEEFYSYESDQGDDKDSGLLAFSDGTVLRIVFDDDGCWRITRVATGAADYNLVQVSDPYDDYSDKATLSLDGKFRWVMLGTKIHVVGKNG